MGRKKVVGKPLLYGTTQDFLTHFGLNSLADLPTLEEFGALAAHLTSAPMAAAPTTTGSFEEEGEGPHVDEEFEDATESDSEREDDGDDS